MAIHSGPVDRRITALLGTFLFFCIAPASVAGWIPWMITRWRMKTPFVDSTAAGWVGALMIAAGAVIVVESFLRFALKGLGTPAPIAPTRHLVVSGLYRYFRNPMYVGVVLAILGQAMLFDSLPLFQYALLVWGLFFAFVLLYEEPALRRQSGAEYEEYRRHVPRWLPRLTPWNAKR